MFDGHSNQNVTIVRSLEYTTVNHQVFYNKFVTFRTGFLHFQWGIREYSCF